MTVSAAPFVDGGIVIGSGKTLIKAVEFDTEDFNESTPGRAKEGNWSWYFNSRDSFGNYSHRKEYQENEDGPQTENATVSDYGEIGAICYTHDDEWVQYTVTVEKTGIYDFKVWASTGAGAGKHLNISVNGILIGSPEITPKGWGDYFVHDVGVVKLVEGTNILKLAWAQGDANVAAFEIKKIEAYKDLVVGEGVTVIEAEDFDIGFYAECTSPWGPAFAGRPDEKVATEGCSNGRADAPDPNYNIGWISGGDWVQYTVNAELAGAYNFSAWLASGAGSKGGVELYVNGEKFGFGAAVGSDGWQDWKFYNVGVANLNEGLNVIKAVFPTGDVNLDALTVEFLGEKMNGELIGAVGGWGDNPATGRAAAFDGDLGTFFDPAAQGNPEYYCGMQMENEYILTQIQICPRSGFLDRFEGASIYGFNDDVFDPETATLIWKSGAAAGAAVFQVISADMFIEESNTGFKNFAYFNPVKHGDVAEIVLYGLPVIPPPPPELDLLGDIALTVGDAYIAAAMILSNYIDPEVVLANVDTNVSDFQELALIYAKAVGLLTNTDIAKYNQIFFRPSSKLNKAFSFENELTRQVYSGIVFRMFELLKKHGIEFNVGEETREGDGYGIQTKNIVDQKFGTDWGYFKDYKTLATIYEQAVDFALATGALKSKKYSELSEDAILALGRNFKPAELVEFIYDENAVLLGSKLVEVERFLAPNDIITWNDIYGGLMPILLNLEGGYTTYTRFNQFMSLYAELILPPTTAVTLPATIEPDEAAEANVAE